MGHLKAFWYKQIGSSVFGLCCLYLFVVLIFCVLIIVRLRTGIPFSYFTSDPVTTLHAPWYAGFVSNVGILFWCASSAISLFAYALIVIQKGAREKSSFLLYSGLITFMLMVDDLWLIHEQLSDKYSPLAGSLFQISYAGIMLFYWIRFKKIISKTEYFLLFLSVMFLYQSLWFDFLVDWMHCKIIGEYLLEDGAKLLGIVSWFAYYARTSARLVREVGLVEHSK